MKKTDKENMLRKEVKFIMNRIGPVAVKQLDLINKTLHDFELFATVVKCF